LQCAVDRRIAVIQQLCDLSRRPIEHISQDEHHALLGRQQLHRGDERKPDGFVGLHTGRWL